MTTSDQTANQTDHPETNHEGQDSHPVWNGEAWILRADGHWLIWDGAAWLQTGVADGSAHTPQGSASLAPNSEHATLARPVTTQPGLRASGAQSLAAPSSEGVRIPIAAIGGVIVGIAAFLPFIAQVQHDGINGVFQTTYVKPGAIHTSCVFGLILVCAALAANRRGTGRAASVVTLCLGVLGAFGYLVFLLVGEVGVTADEFGTKVTWSPGAGLIFSIIGCLVVIVGALSSLRRR